MSRPITKKLSVTDTENTHLIGAGLKALQIKNEGSTDCQIDFDKAIDADSYLLEAGETLSVEFPIIRLSFKTATGSTTLYLIKLV